MGFSKTSLKLEDTF